jgi:hypothetical protein
MAVNVQRESSSAEVKFATSGGRVPPHDAEAEISVLGCVLLDNEALHAVLEVLRPGDFYRKAHDTIFTSMLQLSDRQEPIDMHGSLKRQRYAGPLFTRPVKLLKRRLPLGVTSAAFWIRSSSAFLRYPNNAREPAS